MQQDEIRSIRRTWAATTATKGLTGEIFYHRLFDLSPGARELFRNDMAQQGMKLETTLNFIIDHLDQLEKVMPDARQLAIRHVAYGVKPEHYPAVGEALVLTMQQVLGDKFTDADEAAWHKAYGFLSSEMIDAAYS